MLNRGYNYILGKNFRDCSGNSVLVKLIAEQLEMMWQWMGTGIEIGWGKILYMCWSGVYVIPSMEHIGCGLLILEG